MEIWVSKLFLTEEGYDQEIDEGTALGHTREEAEKNLFSEIVVPMWQSNAEKIIQAIEEGTLRDKWLELFLDPIPEDNKKAIAACCERTEYQHRTFRTPNPPTSEETRATFDKAVSAVRALNERLSKAGAMIQDA